MSHNTGHPVPSIDMRDFEDNAENLDTLLHSTDATWVDRLGESRPTIKHLEEQYKVTEEIRDEIIQAKVEVESASLGANTAMIASEAARDAALLSRGIWPTTAAATGQGVAGVASVVPGSGGANGTFALGFSGGTQVIAPQGYFVVAGGSVTQVVITYSGHYSAGTPTLSFSASAGLTGASATAVMAANTPVGAYFSTPTAPNYAQLYRVDAGPIAVAVGDPYPSIAQIAAMDNTLQGLVGWTETLPASVRTNLVKNPQPNVDPTGGDWTFDTLNGAATVAYVTVGSERAAEATWSSAVATAGGGRLGPGSSTNDLIELTAGVYTASMLARVTQQQRVRATIRFYSAANAQLGEVFGGSRILAANTEESFTVTATAPANTNHARTFIEVVSAHVDSTAWVVGGKLRVRRAIVEAGLVVGSYFDGSVGGGSWSGAAGASVSTLTQPNIQRLIDAQRAEFAGALRTNLYANPIAESTTGYGWLTGTGGAASGAKSSRTYSKDGVARQGWLVTWTTATSAVGGGATVGRTTNADVPVVASARQRFLVEVVPSRTQRMTLIASIRKADGSFAASAQVLSRVITAGEENYNLLGLVMDIPADGSHVQLQVVAAGADGANWAIGDTLFVTNVTVETVAADATALDRPFSGQSLGATWTGAPGRSTSTTRSMGVATERDAILFGNAVLNGSSIATDAALTPDRVRGVTSYAAGLIANARARSAHPASLSVLDGAHDLTAELGAGYTEYGYAVAPVTWLGLLPSTITVAGATYRSNATSGPGGPRLPFGCEFTIDSNGADLLVRFHGNRDEATQYPSMGVYIDGEEAGGGWVRDLSGDATDRLAFKISGIPAGRHVIELAWSRADIYSICVPAGAAIEATPARRLRIAMLGDSWTTSSDVWGGAYNASIAFLLGRALGADLYNCGWGGTGYTTGTKVFGHADRLDAIEDIDDAGALDYVIVLGSINDQNGSPAGVQAAATAAFAGLASRCPDTKLIVIGPQSLSTGTNPGSLVSAAGLAAACAVSANVLGSRAIQPALESWIADAMAPWAIAPDGIHPTREGSVYCAGRVLQETLRLMRETDQPVSTVSGWL